MFGFKRVLLVIVIAAVASHAVAVERGEDFFERRVRPLLIERCGECHGADEPENELTLTSVDGIAKGGSTGPLVVPAKPNQSRLIQAVRYTSKLKMPPERKLPAAEIQLLEQWVRDGAVLPGKSIPVRSDQGDAQFTEEDLAWWAIQPIRDPVPPEVKRANQVRTVVDRFVLKKLDGLSLSPPADRRTLIRRVTLDLIGLPPSPDEVDEFMADDRPDAFERLVDRLLASPHYGERWGRHWLDLARYADTNGGGFDYVYPNAWRYRDYVVRALNADKPYDQFLIEQLAGDLLPPTENTSVLVDRLAATGFLTLAPKGLGMQDKELMALDVVDDQIDVLGRSLMGITLACARCHDHKFDPIPTKDYYALAGIFRSTVSLTNTDKNPSYWPESPLEHPSVTQARKQYQTRKSANAKAVAETKKQANLQVSSAARERLPDYLLAASRLWRLRDEAPAIAHWTLDEIDGDVVKATTGPDGKLANSASAGGAKPTKTDGRFGGALRFTGKREVVSMREKKSLDFGTSTDFSLSFWLRAATGYSPKTADTVIAAKYPSAMWFVALRPGSFNGVYLRHYDGKRAVDVKPSSNQLPTLANGEWHQLVFTSDRNGIATIYIDGEQTGAVSIAAISGAAKFSGEQTFNIGAETNGFQGDLDDVAIWNRLLSPTEVRKLFTSNDVAQIENERSRSRQTVGSYSYEQAAKDGLVPSIIRNFVSLLDKAEVDAKSPLHWLTVTQPSDTSEIEEQLDESKELKKLVDDEKQSPFTAGTDAVQFYQPAVKQQLAKLDDEAKAIAKTQVPDPTLAMIALDAQKPTDLRVHIAGDRKNLGEPAPRGFPPIIAGREAPSITADQSGRLELAHWLTSDDHPLTARVFANRIWQWHFGEGLVPTPDNFGRLGEPPSDPELLDWLASRLIHSGWSVKQLHRQIVLSATYRQRGGGHVMKRRRVEAEALRDSMLAASGQIDRRIGGTVNTWKAKQFSVDDANNETANYKTNRRSIYLPVVRGAAVHEMLQLFDFGDPNSITARRDVTTVAPQALFLMNNPFVIEQSKHFAQRLLQRIELDDLERIRLAYRLALSRHPSESEFARAQVFVRDVGEAGWQIFCQSLFCLNEFAYAD